MVYNISLTLILAILLISISFLFLLIYKKRKKSIDELIQEIENNLLDIKKNLENIRLILKKEQKEIKRKHARKRSIWRIINRSCY